MKVFITGEPGIGKTTLIRKVVEKLGDRAIGFWTQEVREGKRRVGFKVVTTDGEERLFASKTFTSKHLVGSYGVNVKRFEELVLPILLRALKEGEGKVVVIDEIGKMELFSKGFRDLVKEIAHNPRLKVLATLPIRDVHPLVKELRRMRGAVLIELRRENREGMEDEILKLLT